MGHDLPQWVGILRDVWLMHSLMPAPWEETNVSSGCPIGVNIKNAMRHVWFILMLLTTVHLVTGQPAAYEWAWKPILDMDGVRASYIVYREADNENNGVVILLANRNEYEVSYRFKIIFRAAGAGHVAPVSGTLKAGESKTGDGDGLFWIPFKDGRTIGEIGVRGFRITPLRDRNGKNQPRRGSR